MTELINDLLLRALLRKETKYTPVWIMRQAGRYLPEYRLTRAKAGSFMELCRNVDYATEVSLQPLDRFNLDAAILFSDILTIPDAMGLGLSFVDNEGPVFANPLRHENEIMALRPPVVEDKLSYVFAAVRSIKKELSCRVPLIGFSGSPFTLACYMIEGRSSTDFRHIKTMLYSRPDLLHHILKVNALSVIDYLNGQIIAGAQVVQIFDTWGGMLSDAAFHEFSLAYVKIIVDSLIREYGGQKVPVILFTKGGNQWLEDMADTGVDCIGLDWVSNIAVARQRVGSKVALQGNCDPSVLFASDQNIKNEVSDILSNYGFGAGHVFNLGHGISQYTDPDKVHLLIEHVHQISKAYHQKFA